MLFIQGTCFYFARLAVVLRATMGVRMSAIHMANTLSLNGAVCLKHQTADSCVTNR
jgi:hypothetical protein